MTKNLSTFCQFNSLTYGTADFIVGLATPNHLLPENCNVTDQNVYNYYAQSADGSQWEGGSGKYTVLTHTLQRQTISANSDGTLVPINFTNGFPIVDVMPNGANVLEPLPITYIPPGNLMLFQQSSAPVGWTKQITHNDKALRVVSGSASSGGSNNFSSIFTNAAAGGHALTLAELPTVSGSCDRGDVVQVSSGATLGAATGSGKTLQHSPQNVTGGSGAQHFHLFSLQYVDLIIAIKD